MAYSRHDNNTNTGYSSCCMYDHKKYTCGNHGKNLQLHDAAHLNDHYFSTDGQIIATELELLASRCRMNDTLIKSICPKHRSDYRWQKDSERCKLADCRSTTKCVRVGQNASIKIRKCQPYTNFPIRKFFNEISKHSYYCHYHL
jgi:hypothetical protein